MTAVPGNEIEMAVTFGSFPKNFRYLTNQSKHSTSTYEHTRVESYSAGSERKRGSETEKVFSHCCCFVPVLRTLASTSVVIFSRQVFIVCFCLLFVAVSCNSGTAFFCVIQHWKILMKSSGTARVAIFVWPRDSQAQSKFSKIRHYSWFQPM